jgi:hypothetical protein
MESANPDTVTAGQGAQGSEFLWVDYKDGKKQDLPFARTKQAFIRARSHRLRRETKLQKLKASMTPFPTGLVQPPHHAGPGMRHSRTRANDRDRWAPVLYQSPQAGVAEAFPSLSSASNVDLHFDYCKHTGHSATLTALCRMWLTARHCRPGLCLQSFVSL